jgi:hypothetical protein
MRFLVSLFAILSASASLHAQSSTASVEGKVVNAITGAAVKKAVVTIRNTNGQYVQVAPSDASGKFHIDNVQPEKYIVSADAEGFASTTRGGASQKLITVSAAQQVTGVEVAMPPLSIITGKILDEDGEPLDGVNVMALRYTYNNGTKILQAVSTVQTDDRGQYRIFDLWPGRYYLAASAPSRLVRPMPAQGAERIHSTVPEEGYPSVIYPGVADASQTSPHEIKPGADWTGADFKLHKLPAYHIRGNVNGAIGANGAMGAGGGRGMVRAEPCHPDPLPVRNFLMPIMGRDGAFDLAGAVPGTYCVEVMEGRGGGIVAHQLIAVKDADVSDISLTPEASFSLKGTVIVEGPTPSNMQGLGIVLRSSLAGQQMGAQVGSDLTFHLENLVPGRYTVGLNSPPQFYVKSIQYGGQDVSNAIIPNAQPGVSLVFTIATDPGEIDGTVQSGALESGTPVTLVAVPDDAHAERADLYRVTSSSAPGTFTLPGLAPGEYKLFALQQGDFEDSRNRDLLKLLEGRATAVTVRAGGHEQASVMPVSADEIEKAKGKLQ